MKKITPHQLDEQLQTKSVKVIDVRAPEKFAANHLEHTNALVVNIPKTTIFEQDSSDEEHALPFSKDEPIVLTCTTGNSATRCAHILSDKGYNVSVLDGGMTEWIKSSQ